MEGKNRMEINIHRQKAGIPLKTEICRNILAADFLTFATQFFTLNDSRIMQFNPWHSVHYGDENGDKVNGIIEIPKNSRAKYELDKNSGMLKLDRVLYSSVYYPANYGFIPQTYCDDNDPLDILILSQIEVQPLCIVQAKIIGVMRMLDQGESDDKIIAVCANDMSVAHINDISELPEHFLKEIQQFFEEYKKLEHKVVKIETFQGARLAKKIFQHAVRDYETKIKPEL